MDENGSGVEHNKTGMVVLGWDSKASNGSCSYFTPPNVWGVALPPYDPNVYGLATIGPELFVRFNSRDEAKREVASSGTVIWGWQLPIGGMTPAEMREATREALARPSPFADWKMGRADVMVEGVKVGAADDYVFRGFTVRNEVD